MAKKKRKKGRVRSKLPPLHCRLCKFLLKDDKFREIYRNWYVCGANDEINPKFIEHCDDFKLGKWSVVEYLKGELDGIRKLTTHLVEDKIDKENFNALIAYLIKHKDMPDLSRLRLL